MSSGKSPSPVGYIVGNLIFLRIEKRDVFISNSEYKYMVTGVTGGLIVDEVYTESEIKAQYPDAQSFNSILDIHTLWRNSPDKAIGL